MPRFIFIAGGVMSGIGKGVATASIGKILQSKGFKVTAIKIDPYVNVDAGTMNPIEHGEVFVTDDGTECDQDIGNYERFLDEDLTTDNYITTGRVYQAVINRERNLEYDGRCVEVVPHIPEEVISRIKRAAKKTKSDFILIEIGGTVGEYQNLLFLEATRMMKLREPERVLFILDDKPFNTDQDFINLFRKELDGRGIKYDEFLADDKKTKQNELFNAIKGFNMIFFKCFLILASEGI